MLGQEVLTKELLGSNLQAQELDLTQQSKGFYLIKVQSGSKVYLKKIQIN